MEARRGAAAAATFWLLLLLMSASLQQIQGLRILMATMGGTKSHTVPFAALGKQLQLRGHNVTLASGFRGTVPPNSTLRELVSVRLEEYITNYTATWDLVGSRIRNEWPLSPWDAMRYGWESCDSLLGDEYSVALLQNPEGDPRLAWDVALVDGAFPECLLGVLHRSDADAVPTIMLNTVALYTGSLSRQGNPTPWSVRTYFGEAFTQDMNFFDKLRNAFYMGSLEAMHWIMTTKYIQPILRKRLGNQVPDVRELVSEVPLTLQNSHYAVADAQPFLPNVVNVACIHCVQPAPVNEALDKFLEAGFVFVSMGSSVKESGMPRELIDAFVHVLSSLPYNVVWKWDGGFIPNLPPSVRVGPWWPQQDLLGHRGLRAFVSHGGLLSLHEAAYHGAPTLVLPVFCDHDGNAAQAAKLGYALVMEFETFTAAEFRENLLKVASPDTSNPYRLAAKKRSELLKDVPMSAVNMSVWWVEHVARHRGADHLKSSARHIGLLQYYCFDVLGFYLAILCASYWLVKRVIGKFRPRRRKLKLKES
ncbi:unnamed protein product [Trichogramma brassicae]|uniref:UDP-glucuronosyltransferase n=1 Tax=Trichogramma brassicae TaxID=86971 RepID=A0A6H5IJU6_9HYME|nr:unnamed protein product [Trichogramma brassicae]